MKDRYEILEPCIQENYPSLDDILEADYTQLRDWYRTLNPHLCYGEAQRLVIIAKRLVVISNAKIKEQEQNDSRTEID
jgi:hypothetical protein